MRLWLTVPRKESEVYWTMKDSGVSTMLRTNAFVGKTVTTEMTSQCLNMQKDRVSSPRQDLSLHGLVSVPSRTMAYQVRAKSITRTQLKQGKTVRLGLVPHWLACQAHVHCCACSVGLSNGYKQTGHKQRSSTKVAKNLPPESDMQHVRHRMRALLP